jgi:inhibitor of cysteine peptidase
LFDVSDMSQPKEADKIELGGQGSDSLALHEHKAVLADRGRGFLVLPIELRDYSARNYQTTFSGAALFKISGNNIEEVGRFSHYDKRSSGSTYDRQIMRILYVGDNLYSLSNGYLQVNALSDLSLVTRVPLTGQELGVDPVEPIMPLPWIE